MFLLFNCYFRTKVETETINNFFSFKIILEDNFQTVLALMGSIQENFLYPTFFTIIGIIVNGPQFTFTIDIVKAKTHFLGSVVKKDYFCILKLPYQ